jgi:hypothetical protein
MDVPEKIIQRRILTFLKEIGIYAWHNKTTGVFDKKKGIFRRPVTSFEIKGVADILGILPDGRLLAIEVKSKAGTLSEYQRQFIRQIQANNGIAFISRSVTQTFEQLKPFLTHTQKYEAIIGSWMRLEASLDTDQ